MRDIMFEHQNGPEFSRDRLMMLARQKGAEAAYEALHPVQNLGPEEMVMGISILFAAVCHRIGMDPQEAHALGSKVLHADEPFAQSNMLLQSLRDFAGIRIKGDRNVSIS